MEKNEPKKPLAALSKFDDIVVDDSLQNGDFLAHLADCSHVTGGFVHFPMEYGFVPVLVGNDEKPVLLYKIVEEIESLLDPDDIREQFPTLSYTKIVGALMFLRKMAQFNTRGLDLDDAEDAVLEKSEAFQKELMDSLKNGANRRVRSSD